MFPGARVIWLSDNLRGRAVKYSDMTDRWLINLDDPLGVAWIPSEELWVIPDEGRLELEDFL